MKPRPIKDKIAEAQRKLRRKIMDDQINQKIKEALDMLKSNTKKKK